MTCSIKFRPFGSESLRTFVSERLSLDELEEVILSKVEGMTNQNLKKVKSTVVRYIVVV